MEVLVERERNASEIRDQHLLLEWCSSSSGFKGFKEKWSKGRWGCVSKRKKQRLVPNAKLGFLPWMAMASVRELVEVTIPPHWEPAKGSLSGVCPVPLWVFPPITRDARLRNAGLFSTPSKHNPHALSFFGLFSKAAPLKIGNLIFWTWSRKAENWVLSWRAMISDFPNPQW